MKEARWEPGDAKLSIEEQGGARAPAQLVDAVDPAAWERLGLRVSRVPGEREWRVRASQYVGVARVRIGAHSLPIEILPKLPVDVFFLAEYAFGIRERNAIVDRRLRANLAAIDRDPTACLIAWFLADVEAFARRFIRRGYKLRKEVLESGLRERFLLDEYVGRHLAEGRPQEMPCAFPDLTLDIPANRAVRATVRLALARSRQLATPEARSILARHARQVLSLLAGIPDERLRSDTFARLARMPHPGHYRLVLGHCEAFASGLFMDLQVGAHERQAFLWDMNSLFEEGLRGALRTCSAARLEETRPRASIHDPADRRLRVSKVDPDFVLRMPSGTRLILDAKYKDTGVDAADMTEIAIGSRKLRISRADVYQAVAYRAHDRYADASVGLVFPIALERGQSLPQPHCVRGFGQPVHLLFFDVGAAAAENLSLFFASVSAAMEQSQSPG